MTRTLSTVVAMCMMMVGRSMCQRVAVAQHPYQYPYQYSYATGKIERFCDGGGLPAAEEASQQIQQRNQEHARALAARTVEQDAFGKLPIGKRVKTSCGQGTIIAHQPGEARAFTVRMDNYSQPQKYRRNQLKELSQDEDKDAGRQIPRYTGENWTQHQAAFDKFPIGSRVTVDRVGEGREGVVAEHWATSQCRKQTGYDLPKFYIKLDGAGNAGESSSLYVYDCDLTKPGSSGQLIPSTGGSDSDGDSDQQSAKTTSSAAAVCGQCGENCDLDDIFCGECGNRLRCKCGENCDLDDIFCGDCGNRLPRH